MRSLSRSQLRWPAVVCWRHLDQRKQAMLRDKEREPGLGHGMVFGSRWIAGGRIMVGRLKILVFVQGLQELQHLELDFPLNAT